MIISIVENVADRSPAGLASTIARLIRGGVLPPGGRLPTVRVLAAALQTSPSTVAKAWERLSRAGMIVARGRHGTHVRSLDAADPPHRYRRITASPGVPALDLSTGLPDPALLPDLGTCLARIELGPTDLSPQNQVLPELEELLRERWPFDPDMLTIVDGTMDALERVIGVTVGFGDEVLVENPCYPPLLDLLDKRAAKVIGLPMDQSGVRVDALVEAVRGGRAVALFLQPRAQNPSGSSLTPQRAAEIAHVVRGTDLLVVEDDHSADLVPEPAVSIGASAPGQVVHVRGFSKSFGPDLRLAALGGAAEVVSEVVERRALGPGWSSRLLQAVLLDMLCDTDVLGSLSLARATYAVRRQTFVSDLRRRGVRIWDGSGVNAWVAVSDEQTALLSLATRGVGVAPGTPFVVDPLERDHIRITTGLLPDSPDRIDRLAAQVAEAAVAPCGARRPVRV